MRVMLLVTDLLPGGTPMRIARLARGLRDRGVEVVAGCLSYEGPVSVEIRRSGILTFACDANGPWDLGALRRMVGYVRRYRPDLIHATLFHANTAARLTSLWTGTPVITSTATIEVERRWHRWLESLTARLDQGHLVNSRAVAEHVRRVLGVPRSRIHVVPPLVAPGPKGVDRRAVRSELGLEEHEFAVMWTGRLDRVKRVEIVVECAEIMSGVPARFFVIGEGRERARLERMIRTGSAGRRLHLLGWRDDNRRLLAGGDAFVFPSLTEGMPNALMEAMWAGLPAVASDIPANRELAEKSSPGEGGAATGAKSGGGEGGAGEREERMILIQGEDARSYAEALTALYADRGRREAMGKAAARFAKEFLDERRALDAVIGVYKRVAGEDSD